MYFFKKQLFFSLLVVIVGLAMISTQAFAQDDVQAELSGQAVNADTQEPVSGANITLVNEDEETTTDEDGSFSFEELDPGTYTLNARAEGYENWEQEVEVTEQGGGVQIELQPTEDQQ